MVLNDNISKKEKLCGLEYLNHTDLAMVVEETEKVGKP